MPYLLLLAGLAKSQKKLKAAATLGGKLGKAHDIPPIYL